MVVFRALALLVVGVVWVTSSCGLSPECSRHADCATSDVLRAAGRCPAEAYCSEGSCHPGCLKLCKVVRQDFNPCNAGLICSESQNGKDPGLCRGRPIVCQVDDDCPIFLPTPDQSWSCIDGTCRFPEFQYAYE